ncbi:MAG: DinB family protein [Pirellulales bacterium]|nr:DinB family protein [Pirellulales bacterium]
MNAIDAIKNTMTTSTMVLKNYISDLEDSELMKRPGPECNHLAWQLGHLIASECMLLESLQPGAAAELPEGFAAQHDKETCGEDDPAKFCTKAEYLELFDKVQAATTAALDKLSEADLDGPAPERFREMFPTAGHIYILIATHPMMHAGQFVPVRRALGKPILM